EAQCEHLGELARDAGIALSVHAPYFAALTTLEPDRVKLHVGALHHSCKLANAMGATVVVAHPGSTEGVEPEELHRRIDLALEALAPRVADLGVKLGLETAGRKSQFGTLGDIALVVRRHSFTTPVIDFAHIHAVSGGLLSTAEAFEAIFDYITNEFSVEHLRPLHCHFTDNRFGDAGEITHIPYGEGTLRIGNLYAGAEKHDLSLTIVSEARWEESHKQMFEELRASGAPLGGPLGNQEGVPSAASAKTVPLLEKNHSHYFKSGKREVRITNKDKVLFPDDGYTKGDLVNYYWQAAPLMLPFLKDRPIVMQRVPDGIYEEAFYEKQAPKGTPEWVSTVPVSSEGGSRTIDYVVVDDVATLVWLAQIASVECHAWTSKWPRLDEPDFAVMDLDPHEPVSFEDVRNVAKLVKVVLDRFDIRAFPKTSGGAGMQIFIPITAGHTYAEVRQFCSGVGRLIQHAYPEKVTLEPSKPRRKGKVFIDANQNSKGKTLVAPYSVRQYPLETVSAPLLWEELDEEFYPEAFTIETIFDRVAEIGDPFRPALAVKQDLHPVME
ncbi:MAG: non-homologous end-joining DNA ligase, partial [Acidimicrobiia bacterium]